MVKVGPARLHRVIITGVLSLSIRNEWDSVTRLAPRADGAELTFEARTLGK